MRSRWLCPKCCHSPRRLRRYRSGFAADATKVHAEWLFRRRGTAKVARLFTREGQDIRVNPEQFRERRALKNLAKDLGKPPVRENALVLSVAAHFNGQTSDEIMDWFKQLRFTSGLSDRGHFVFTAERLKDSASREKLLSFVRRADFNIAICRAKFPRCRRRTCQRKSRTK